MSSQSLRGAGGGGGLESEHCSAGPSMSKYLTRLRSRCQPRLPSHLKGWLGSDPLPNCWQTVLIVGTIQSQRTVGKRASGPSPVNLSTGHLTAGELASQSKQAGRIRGRVRASFLWLDLGSTISSHLTFALFCSLEESHQAQPTQKGRGFTKGSEYQAVEITGIFETASYRRCVSSIKCHIAIHCPGDLAMRGSHLLF